MATKDGQRTRWDALVEYAMKSLERSARDPTNYGMLAPIPVGVQGAQAISHYFNSPVASAKPTTAAAAASPVLSFAAPPAEVPTGTPPASAGGGPSSIDAFLAANFPGAKITSGARDAKHNAEVGGVPNSMHLTDQARDFVLPDMSTAARKQAKKFLESTGQFTEVLDEGNHLHVGWRPAVRTANPTVTPQQAMAGGVPVSFLDPATVMSMIPNAPMIPQVRLPNAPQRELPGDIPLYEEPDKAGLLAEMAAAIKPKERNAKFDKWDRIAALLQGAATGAAGADPNAGFGQWLLRAGAGGLGGFRSETKEQRAEQDLYDERLRQAQVQLAKMGLDIDLSALGTRNANKDRGYQSGENKKGVQFQNAQEVFEQQLKQIATNLGITEGNVNRADQRGVLRATTGIQAMQGGVAAQNAANSSVIGAGAQPAAAQQRGIDAMLIEAGIPATQANNPYHATASGTAAAILSGDVNGALQNLSQELVMNGAAATILAPDKGDSPAAAKVKQEALRALKGAKKASDPGAAQAAQAIAQLLASDNAAALAIAKAYQTTSPSARLILQHNKAGAK